MSIDSPRVRFTSFFGILTGIAVVLSLCAFGCGASEESTDEWETTPTVSPVAQLEYRVDSLTNLNRRLKEQLDAVSGENRNLTARNAELETRLNETAATPRTATPMTPSVDVSSGYSGALAQFRRRDFAGAIDQFEALLKGGIREDLAGNCHYWIGESYYGMRKYNDAIRHFETVFDYKRSGKKDDAQLMIGNCYLASGNKAAARESYEKLVSTYATSPLVRKAQDKLARLK